MWSVFFLDFIKYWNIFILRYECKISPLSSNQPHKMVKQIQTIRPPTNCLSMFDGFVELALKGLSVSFV